MKHYLFKTDIVDVWLSSDVVTFGFKKKIWWVLFKWLSMMMMTMMSMGGLKGFVQKCHEILNDFDWGGEKKKIFFDW